MSKISIANIARVTRSKKAMSIALVLVLTTVALITSISSVNATVLEVDTFAFTMASPNPVGINQQVIITAQIDKVSPTASGVAGGEHFTGLMVNITAPDGTIDTSGPYTAYAMSNAFFYYTPTQTGTYKLQTFFPGQWINTTDYEYWFKPSASAIFELTVQQDQIEAYPAVPLPTDADYWERPIYGENKGWYQIADNWLMRKYDRPSRFFSGDTAFAPYTSAPNSPHILWNKPIIFGGIGGGQYGDKIYYTGLSYEQFYNPLILNGRIIYVDHGPYSYGDSAGGSIDPFGEIGYGTYCLDLYTGEEIWYMNNTIIMFAQLFDIENPNEHGLIAHLWEVSPPDEAGMSTWKMYDAFTGRYVLTITNVPMLDLQENAVVFGPNGELLSYTLDPINNRLVLWNSTLALGGFPSNIYYPERYNLIQGSVVNGLRGIQWNVSIPDIPGEQAINKISLEDGVILASWETVHDWSQYTEYPGTIVEVAYPTTLTKDQAGNYPTSINHLWTQNRTNIQGRVFYSNNIGDGVYTIFDSPTLRIRGYNVTTGQELWVTDPISTSGWAYYTYMHHIAYGKLYIQGYDGYIRAINLTDGSLEWEQFSGNAGFETIFGTWPSYAGFNIADHKIYITNDEHSPDSVPWRGGKLWCFNADTGDLLWTVSGWIRHGAISDGILTALNSLDGQVYTFGKGPSETTVTATPKVTAKGSSVMVEGTVLDMSPGKPETPAVADESMGPWMEYLYMQKPMPTDVQGVTVKLYAIDPNGNYQDIDTVTTDMWGNFGTSWTPPVEGNYLIIAEFEGTASYGSSSASTYMAVGPAPSAGQPMETEEPTTAPPPTTEEPSTAPPTTEEPTAVPTEAPVITTEVLIIAAVGVAAIIGVGAYWVLRRRK